MHASDDETNCLSRSVFIWRIPNLIDDRNLYSSSSHGEDYYQCVEEALDSNRYPHLKKGASPMDINTIQEICQHSTFSKV